VVRVLSWCGSYRGVGPIVVWVLSWCGSYRGAGLLARRPRNRPRKAFSSRAHFQTTLPCPVPFASSLLCVRNPNPFARPLPLKTPRRKEKNQKKRSTKRDPITTHPHPVSFASLLLCVRHPNPFARPLPLKTPRRKEKDQKRDQQKGIQLQHPLPVPFASLLLCVRQWFENHTAQSSAQRRLAALVSAAQEDRPTFKPPHVQTKNLSSPTLSPLRLCFFA